LPSNGGLLFLDAPITFLLPELFDPSLLTGFNSTGASEFNKPEMEVTLTMKVSHQSGTGNIIVHTYRTKLHNLKSTTGEAIPNNLSSVIPLPCTSTSIIEI
jgi:hypothetical protein